MKTCLVVIFAFALGVVESSINNLSIDMNRCRSESFIGPNRDCWDHQKLKECLDGIKTEDDIEANVIQEFRNWVETTKCPELETKGSCIKKEKYKCMREVYSLKSSRTKDVCDEAPIAKSCLLKANSSCPRNQIGFEFEDVENIEKLCKDGHYSGGPCSVQKVAACTEKVLNDFKVLLDDAAATLKCESTSVAEMRKCLKDLKENCKTDAMQKELKRETDYVNTRCPL